ncbi:hypothetical protein [Microbacterium murale]|uniref:Uncharacterized protein n=1 Tax=Microbacterium murale TaxID=1081040 RepID=A0ABU0PEB4_9MICO|nr:hypothetical protein [Microbacterium murale]MDQ0645664.1 hypothetical protein [Microbacterium murale]
MTFQRLGSRSRPSITLDRLERAIELLDYRLAPTPGDDMTYLSPFPESEWTLEGSAYQSLDAGSLYRYAREHSGETVAFTIRPLGNAMATAYAPHYTGEVVIGPKPALGGSASARFFVFEFAWEVPDEPTEVIE